MEHVRVGLCSDGDCPRIASDLIAALRSPKAHPSFDKLAAIATTLGFNGFSYLLIARSQTSQELVEHWTTAGSNWIAQYATRGYHLVDPRVTQTRGRSTPIAWASSKTSGEARESAFLTDAARYSIRSGIAMSFHDPQGNRSVIACDSNAETEDASRERVIGIGLSTLALLAGFVNDGMAARRRSEITTAQPQRLTRRECECIGLAARGMTSGDIAVKLGITERTANFHIGNIIEKFGALNRGEAIARAVALNLC